MSQESSLSSVSGSIQTSDLKEDEAIEVSVPKRGLSMGLSAVYIIAYMAGAGFLSLPKAVANTGWIGVALIIVFCVMVGFSGTRLGLAWIILEERWPEYKKTCRMPYMDIAERSLGIHGRRLVLACYLFGMMGGAVFLLLIAQLLNGLFPSISMCTWLMIVSAIVLPFSWLGSPKDLWQISLIAAICTAIACLIIFIFLLLDIDENSDPFYQNPTIYTFSLGYGAILFTFGGLTGFPTLQNDMKDRTLLPKSVSFGFAGLLVLYLPMAVAGYAVQGIDVSDNILLSVRSSNPIFKVAIVLEILNLCSTFVMGNNPIVQIFEELFSVSSKFGLSRIAVRSSLVTLHLIVGLAIPDFGMILNLIGGSTVTMTTFILPPLMYMRLIDVKGDPSWPQRSIPLWERILLWEIIVVGVVGGITCTISAVTGIITQSFAKNCFNHFYD